MIQFTCTCGKPLQAEEQYAGLKTRCPDCGREQPIPSLGTIQSDVTENLARSASTDVQGKPRRERGDPRSDLDARPAPQTSGKAIAALVLGLLSFVFLIFTAIPALVFAFLALGDIGRSQGRLTGKPFAIAGLLAAVLSLLCLTPAVTLLGLLPSAQLVLASRDSTLSQNNLKQLSIAIQNYENASGTLPPQQGPLNTRGPGTHNFSWRVHILPYIEQDQLYLQFDPNEPWDGPNNIQLLSSMPKIYQLPGKPAPLGYTYYQVFVCPLQGRSHSMFIDNPQFPGITDVTDGTSLTLLIVEGDTPVPWTKPADIAFDPDGPAPRIGRHYRGGCNAVFVDGSIRFLSGNLSSETLKALITRDGGELVPTDY